MMARAHAEALCELGHDVTVVTNEKIRQESTSKLNFLQLKARGSGALYSPISANNNEYIKTIQSIAPDYIFIEGWQTGLTETAIKNGINLRIKTIVISHGISIWPHRLSAFEVLRSLCWLPYYFFRLRPNLKKIYALTTVSEHSPSKRFSDRNIATISGNPQLHYLPNFPANITSKEPTSHADRAPVVIVAGYFSRIKNQVLAIKIAAATDRGIKFRFIGKKEGRYFENCKKLTEKLNLTTRVEFLSDSETSIALEIAAATVVLSTSVTEAMPLVILEAMASGTPYISTDVGAVREMGHGIVENSPARIAKAIEDLFKNHDLWKRISRMNFELSKNKYTKEITKKYLDAIIS
jgi:glycosyltransferase involved in cell wall biosynthesis